MNRFNPFDSMTRIFGILKTYVVPSILLHQKFNTYSSVRQKEKIPSCFEQSILVQYESRAHLQCPPLVTSKIPSPGLNAEFVISTEFEKKQRGHTYNPSFSLSRVTDLIAVVLMLSSLFGDDDDDKNIDIITKTTIPITPTIVNSDKTYVGFCYDRCQFHQRVSLCHPRRSLLCSYTSWWQLFGQQRLCFRDTVGVQ